ncbi:hypothetical protein BGX23_006129 [Mortierella sp. AD031]|nr:hypothetical protein BGX23_006129 [Mortierella sp. AD031]
MTSGDYLQPNHTPMPAVQLHSPQQQQQQLLQPQQQQQQQLPQQQQQQQQHTSHQDQGLQPQLSSPSLIPTDDPNYTQQVPQSSLQPPTLHLPQSFPQGEDLHATSSNTTRNVTITSRIGSTGSQLISPLNEARKRTGRRILHRPRPLDLDHTKLHRHRHSGQHHSTGGAGASASGSDSRPTSSIPGSGSAYGLGIGDGPGSPQQESKKHKFPLLHIKTDFHRPTHFRRAASGPGVPPQSTSTSLAASPGISNINNNTATTTKEEPQKKPPSQWQIGLERMLKKIQRRNRAPSNLMWYAAHSTESYLSGATLESRPGVLKQAVDAEMENLYFGHDKPPKWVVDSLQGEKLFFSDDTVDLVLGLRDYLIKATESGWDIGELKEEIFPIERKSVFPSRRNRSASPHGSPGRSSPNASPRKSSSPYYSAPASPGAASLESGHSMEADIYFQQAAGRYVEEVEGSYRLLDYFMAVLSDIISHDCRYMVQNPRPSRPEWVLHSFVLDILFLLAKSLAHDHKAVYDIGMIALSAFPIFKNHALIRLLDLMADVILPSFALSRTQYYASLSRSPPLTPIDSASPVSPSEIRVQLDNNQTFAIQVHSPTEEQGLLSVPQQRKQSVNSPRMPSSRSSSTSIPMSGHAAQAQDILDTHASSLIQLTLLSILQQISFTKSPLPVAKQVEKSIGGLLRIKPDLSVDLLEVIAIVENEKVMRRAVEVLWWVGKPSLGHLTLAEKFFPLDYDSIMAMRQNQQEWNAPGATNGARTNTVKSDTMFSFRRGSLDEAAIPMSEVTSGNNSVSSFRIRHGLPHRPGLPWKAGHRSGHGPKADAQQQPAAVATVGTDYLAEHELYPYMFSTDEMTQQDQNSAHSCERCEAFMHGFGLFCYRCRGSIHLECFYSVKRFAGIDCTQMGCAFDSIARRPRNQLIYPDEGGLYESNTNRIYRIRSGHPLQLINMFSTCLCSACKLPLWGHHHQAYRCQECSQLMHLDCNGIAPKCGGNAHSVAIRQTFPTQITYEDMRQSFLEFYKDLISAWRACQNSSSTPGKARHSSTGPPSPAMSKVKYSYEEASCNSSVLMIQLELLKAGMTRGEIQVLDWLQDGQTTDQGLMATSGFELLAIQTYFAELTQQLQHPSPSPGTSLFLSDYFEDAKPDQFLLFSELYWGHFAAVAKTMINDSDAAELSFRHPFFTHSNDWGTQEDDIFEHELDAAQEQLLAGHSVRSANITLSSLFEFCMQRLGFRSPWTMQMILQEWVKMGLLERLDGELCLFEVSTMDPISPPPSMPVFRTIGQEPPVAPLPTFQTSSYDNADGKSNVTYRSVHCLFPIVTAIDPTPDVEHVIHSIWRCLSSVDLSVNECGFLLLTRQCWPDPFMSDYTTERLVGCIFHWLLLEDDQLVVIHKNYASKGKKIPGVRIGLEEHLTVKRVVTGLNITGTGISDGAGVGTETGVSSGTTMAGFASTSSTAAAAAATGTGIGGGSQANVRNNSTTSNLFGSVGAYVVTRKLMAKKFAIPWLKKVMELDPDRYKDISHRQIRILERELAPEAEHGAFEDEDREHFQHAQKERYLEAITKLRHGGFLFNCFSDILCRWLEEVEEMLEGMNLSSKSFKTLNRLFLKASSRTGSGLGLGSTNTTLHMGGEHSIAGSLSRLIGGKSGDGEWRHRLKTKLHHGSSKGSVHSQSPTGSDRIPDPSSVSGQDYSKPEEDIGETPLGTLRTILDSPDHQGVEGALRWLALLVQSGVAVPTQAFMECSKCLVDMSHIPAVDPADDQAAAAAAVGTAGNAPARPLPSLSAPDSGAASGLSTGTGSFQQVSLRTNRATVLCHSQALLNACWESLMSSCQHMSEADAGQLLETILGANQETVARVMFERLYETDPKELESVRQLLRYSLAIFMYVSGCPLQAILDLQLVPFDQNIKSTNSPYTVPLSNDKGVWPLHQQLHRRQHYGPSQQVALDRESVTVSLLLKSLRSRTLSIQGEVIKCLSVMLEESGRVSNMEEFADSIHKEMLPCLWELLTPLNDHMADTTLPLLMRFASIRPGYLHKTVAQSFSDPDWEVRFGALDPVFGLFSKLDDALVMKLFFQQEVTTTARATTKGKGVDRGHHHLHYLRQKQAGTMPQEPEHSERTGTGLNGANNKTDNRPSTFGASLGGTFGDRGQQFVALGQFQPDLLQILGPIFSHFVSSMWDREEAVRAKAKALLKSLQPVHVGHALKAWELYFVASPSDVQQSLLKLMSRVNNFFPGWKIMDYGLIFRLLTSGELGQVIVQDSGASMVSHGNGGSSRTSLDGGAASRAGSLKSYNTLDSERPKHGTLTPNSDAKGPKSRRASFASLSTLEKCVGAPLHLSGQLPTLHLHKGRQGSFATLPSLDGTTVPGANQVTEQSRSQRRASIVSTTKSAAAASLSSTPIPVLEESEAREKQLELEDDIHCSLLHLALQMVANGIEPRLDEVILLKYLVVFYLDFEGCELVDIGQGKFQVRYGEYIPRRRASPIPRGVHENSASSASLNDVLNDPGHENFVLAICMNLQLILDRYVEIKPDYETDPPTLYDQLKTRPNTPGGGGGGGSAGNVYDGIGAPVGLNSQQPSTNRTFTSTTTTGATDNGKESSRGTMTTPQQDADGDGPEHHHRHHGLFCFPRHKHHEGDHHHNHKHTGDTRLAQSTASQKNTYQTNPNAPLYQQHHHHHYRRKSHRRHDENIPVVGTYFVDVILRFFGSETDLATLPAGRLKNWLELLLIVIYKYVKEVDPLSDLVVVLMKRIVDLLMVKKSGPNVAAVVPASLNGAGVGVNGSTIGSAMGAGVPPGATVTAPPPVVGEESMSEENILLAISICSTLLTRSSIMTTALLSREIMAMGKLMTKRRDDPDDPVLNRARSFLHDAFVHFMGNGLFVLVFKTQPATDISSHGWEEEVSRVDQELDLFYVLATVLGEDEMVQADPTDSSGPQGANRLVHIRDQPIRDILDRVSIFRDLEPVQVSTILTNLALYVERVHSRCHDPRLLPDLAHFLVKVTKYTAEWDQQQQHKQREQAQHLRQAQEQLLLQHHNMKHGTRQRGSQQMISGNTSTLFSNGSSIHLQQLQQQKQGVMSVTSGGSTLVPAADRASSAVISSPLPEGHPFTPARPVEAQRTNAGMTLTPTTTNMSALSGQDYQEVIRQATRQSTMASTGSATPMSQATVRQPSSRQKPMPLKQANSSERESNPYVKYRPRQSTFNSTLSRHRHATTLNSLPPAQKRAPSHHWDYINPVLGMCSILMIQNPFEGHQLVTAVKHVLRQALYRDRISAPALIRVATGYCFMAEQDFSLSLVNVFGEFVVQELKISIQNHSNVRYEDEVAVREDEMGDISDLDDSDHPEHHHHHRLYHRHHRPHQNGGRRRRSSWNGKEGDKGKEKGQGGAGSSGEGGGGGSIHLGRGHVGAAGGGGGHQASGRTKILAHNFHVLHHLLIWDLDPSYNMEWTRIKWDILGSMRFPPGHPILFPGATDALRQVTASIVGDWVDP